MEVPFLRVGTLSPPNPPNTTHTYYDPEALFALKPDVVQGFYTLLAAPEADPSLQYFSVIDGNVLSTCAGLRPTDSPPHSLTRTRAFLAEFQGEERKEREIVYAYQTLFRSLVEYHRDLGSVCWWCIPPCRVCCQALCYRGWYRRETLRVIEEVFMNLERELEAA